MGQLISQDAGGKSRPALLWHSWCYHCDGTKLARNGCGLESGLVDVRVMRDEEAFKPGKKVARHEAGPQ